MWVKKWYLLFLLWWPLAGVPQRDAEFQAAQENVWGSLYSLWYKKRVYQKIYQYFYEPVEFKRTRTVIHTLDKIVQKAPESLLRVSGLIKDEQFFNQAHKAHDAVVASLLALYCYFLQHPALKVVTDESQLLFTQFTEAVRAAEGVVKHYEQLLNKASLTNKRDPAESLMLTGLATKTTGSDLDGLVHGMTHHTTPSASLKENRLWWENVAKKVAIGAGVSIIAGTAYWLHQRNAQHEGGNNESRPGDDRGDGPPSAAADGDVIAGAAAPAHAEDRVALLQRALAELEGRVGLMDGELGALRDEVRHGLRGVNDRIDGVVLPIEAHQNALQLFEAQLAEMQRRLGMSVTGGVLPAAGVAARPVRPLPVGPPPADAAERRALLQPVRLPYGGMCSVRGGELPGAGGTEGTLVRYAVSVAAGAGSGCCSGTGPRRGVLAAAQRSAPHGSDSDDD